MSPRRLRPHFVADSRSTRSRWACWAGLWLWLAAVWLGIGAADAHAQDAAVRLSRGAEAVDAWPAVRVLPDPGESMDAQTAWANRARFEKPSGPYANLGPRPGATWLIVPVQLDADAAPSWVLRLEYALLHDVQLSIRDDRGAAVHEARLGLRVPFEQRSQKTRALSSLITLRPGERYEVLIRVATPTGMLLPIAFMQHTALGMEESREQALQGLMTGVWGFMAIYSLVHGLLRRESLFFAYAAVLATSWLFSQAVYGVGPMWLWPSSTWWAANVSVLAPLLMIPANVLFLAGTLQAWRTAPRTARALVGVAGCAAVVATLHMAGLTSYRMAASAGMVLGAAHLMLLVPLAARRLREGERIAIFVLIGAATNLSGVLAFSLLLRGFLPVSFLSMHWIQFSFFAEMVCWMLVLGTRLEQLRQAAAAAHVEHEKLQVQASTDALTGLHNRRGLEGALAAACSVAARPGTGAPPALCVYMIDLDGFKPVNDRWGHHVGDRLLREVGGRLRTVVRPDDVVARLGGDEFVIVSPGIRTADAAASLGAKLLAAFDRPIDLGEARCATVGATIGYALASDVGCDGSRLLRAADAAMYAGKQAGKHRVMGPVSVSSVSPAAGLRSTADPPATHVRQADPAQAVIPSASDAERLSSAGRS